MYLKTFLTVGLIGIALCSSAQQGPTQRTPRSSGNSLHPGESVPAERMKKRSRANSRRKNPDPVQEYYDRMEDVAKAYRRAEKLSAKPQYSNPMYFGHKRPPRKHSPAKMRYCKECGIRH